MVIPAGPHRCLLSTLTNLLNTSNAADSTLARKNRLKSKSIDMLDFGARIKIVVSEIQGKDDIRLKISFRQGDNGRDDSARYLRELYGSSVMAQRQEDGRTVMFVVSVTEAVQSFDSMSACAMSLSQIRVQAMGAPILKAFSRLQRTSDESVHDLDDFQCQVGSYEQCGTFHCLSTKEK